MHKVKELYDQIQTKHTLFESDGVAEMSSELEAILIKNERENEDLQNLSKALGQYVHVTVDIPSLGVLDRSLSQVTNTSVSNEDYLHQARCEAESTLIKSKILYKLDKDAKLTKSEFKYLAAWKEAMSDSKTLVEDCLVPRYPSSLSIDDMSAQDISKLNQVPLVQLDKELHGRFAVNDLILEMS